MSIFTRRPDLLRSQRSFRSFLQDPLDFLESEMHDSGALYQVPSTLFPLVVTTDLEVIRQVLQSNHYNYIKSPAYRQLKLALGQGLVTAEGEHWKRQRQLAQPAFYKSRLAGLYGTMADVTSEYLEQLEKRMGAGSELDLSREMMHLTARIVLRALFSAQAKLDLDHIYELIMEAQDYVMFRTTHPLQIPFQYINGRHRRFRQSKKTFDAIIFQLIEERRQAVSRPDDLLTMLLEAQLEGRGMTNADLRDELLTLFSAGHETTANAMAWTLFLLANHPAVLQRLRQELDEVLQGGMPRWEDLPRLEYTRWVVQEGMRLYPPAYVVGRQAVESDVLNGVSIEPKTVVLVAIYALHRDPEHWQAPGQFRPERFGEGATKKAYMPFGLGPRMCIGNHFAMMEMQLLLAVLASRLDFEYRGEMPPPTAPLITLRPEAGMPMFMRPRPAKVPR